ncbi:MAG: helix-turn-helix domain-containing protein [Actinobacteria bacterium]|nr:helix-turn-helix domain-containing protein [Actinomycetota bacterium]
MTIRAATRPQLLTIPDTAERLRCSQRHVYRLIATGALRARDIALPGAPVPKTRISEADLAAYVASIGGDDAPAA